MVQVRLLGPVGVTDDGVDVPLGGAKQRAVLACLALNAPRASSVDALVAAVWGEEPPESARNAVQVYVSGLRKALTGRGAEIERAGDGYRLVGEHLGIDAASFEQSVAEGRSALRAGDPLRAATALGDALASWRGEPLSGLEQLPLHATASHALNGTRADALRDLADSHLRAGRPDDAVRAAEDAVAVRPYDEHAWALLATASYHSGRQTEALKTLRRVRELLADELGLDPSPELAELEVLVLNHQLDAPWVAGEPGAGSQEAAAPGLPSLPDPFVGRGELVDEVTRLLESARVVSLVGLGGIGKTTAALAVAHRVAETGLDVRFCDLETETSARGALERVCRSVGLDPGDDPVSAMSAIPGGPLLVLDNVEQVDALGPALADLLSRSMVRVLATSRRPMRLREEHVVQVRPLSLRNGGGTVSPSVELFLARVAQVRPGLDAAATRQAAEAMCAVLDGIPLAIELAAGRARVLTPDQMLARLTDGRASQLDRGRRSDVSARQESLAVVLAATLQLLDGPASTLAQWLASYEGWTTLDLVEPVVGPELGGGFVDALEDLLDAGLVELDDDGRVRMRTPVREFLRPRGDRAAMDRGMVRAVGRTVASVAPTLHGSAAGEGLRRLGLDHDPVTGALSRVVAEGWAEDAAALVVGLNRYWLLSGRVTEARRWIGAARSIPGLSNVDRVRVDLLAGTFASYINDPGAPGLLASALAEVEPVTVPVDRLVVNAWCCLAAVTAHLGDLDEAQAHAESAAKAAQLSGDGTLVALARDLGGHIARYRGDAEAALRATLAGVDDARRSGDRYDLVNLLAAAADDLLSLGRCDEAVALSAEAFDLVTTLDVGPLLGQVLLVRGTALTAAAQLPAARGCLIEALRMTRDRYPDRLAVADIVYTLATGSAMERADQAAARLWGAADAIYRDQGVAPGSRTQAQFAVEREALGGRLGAARAEVLAAAGAGDPDHVVAVILGG